MATERKTALFLAPDTQSGFPFSSSARPVTYTRPPLYARSSRVFNADCFHGLRKGSVFQFISEIWVKRIFMFIMV